MNYRAFGLLLATTATRSSAFAPQQSAHAAFVASSRVGPAAVTLYSSASSGEMLFALTDGVLLCGTSCPARMVAYNMVFASLCARLLKEL